MTFKFTEPNFFDKILKSFGKKRAYRVPEKSTPYSCNTILPESFLQTLLRPNDATPPPGWFYKEDIIDKNTVYDTGREKSWAKKRKTEN